MSFMFTDCENKFSSNARTIKYESESSIHIQCEYGSQRQLFNHRCHCSHQWGQHSSEKTNTIKAGAHLYLTQQSMISWVTPVFVIFAIKWSWGTSVCVVWLSFAAWNVCKMGGEETCYWLPHSEIFWSATFTESILVVLLEEIRGILMGSMKLQWAQELRKPAKGVISQQLTFVGQFSLSFMI